MKAEEDEGQLVDLAIQPPFHWMGVVSQKLIVLANPRIIMNASQISRIAIPNQKPNFLLDGFGLCEALKTVCTSEWNYQDDTTPDYIAHRNSARRNYKHLFNKI